MGFSLGNFIGGAAAGGVSNADEAIKQRDALDLQQHQSDAALAREKAIEAMRHTDSIDTAKQLGQINIDNAEQVRTTKSDRINATAGGIIQQAQLDKWNKENDIDTGEKDNKGASIYRQATQNDVENGQVKLDDGNVDLGSDVDTQLSSHDKTMAHLQAEAQDTGDYSKLATLANSSENMQVKWDAMKAISDNKDATRQYVADQQNATRAAQIQMMATVAGIKASVSAGKSDQGEIFKTINTIDNDIKSSEKELSTNAFLISTINKTDPRYTLIMADNVRLKSEIQENKSSKRSVAQAAGIHLPDAPSAQPAAVVTPAKPFNPADFTKK